MFVHAMACLTLLYLILTSHGKAIRAFVSLLSSKRNSQLIDKREDISTVIPGNSAPVQGHQSLDQIGIGRALIHKADWLWLTFVLRLNKINWLNKSFNSEILGVEKMRIWATLMKSDDIYPVEHQERCKFQSQEAGIGSNFLFRGPVTVARETADWVKSQLE